jgi:hypothetical protein
MKTRYVDRGRLLATFGACLAAVSAIAAAPVFNETLAPSQISIGESAELRISSSGADRLPPKLPVVPGLEFRVVGQLQGVELIHGATLATITTVIRVTPQIAGTFVIPEISPTAQPLVLRVNPANFGGSSIMRHGVGAEPPAGDIRMMEDDSAFLRILADRREVYVGEAVPIAIELGVRAGAVSSLNGLPTLAGNDFTLNDMSRQPDRKEAVVNTEPFLLLTWHTAIAPVKPGEFPLIVEVPLTIQMSTRPRREALLEDQLGDPFMQRRFGAKVRKDIKAVSPPLDLTVEALPLEGRPPEFSGAVGSFQVTSDISSATAAAGDPLTLKMHVTGSGNFDRVDSAMLAHVEHWKSYPPTSSFKSSDALGFKGEKTFEQPVIASTAGAQVLPALTFAYFDPATRRYETVRTSPLSVVISASAADAAPNASAAAAIAPTGLRPDHGTPGVFASSLVPPYLRPTFLAIESLLTAVLAGAWFRQRAAGHPDRGALLHGRGLSKSIRLALTRMDEAARTGDGAQFFALARRALQETLAVRWQTSAELITSSEVDVRLDRDDDGLQIRRLFARADEVAYAGESIRSEELTHWTQFVRRQALRELS